MSSSAFATMSLAQLDSAQVCPLAILLQDPTPTTVPLRSAVGIDAVEAITVIQRTANSARYVLNTACAVHDLIRLPARLTSPDPFLYVAPGRCMVQGVARAHSLPAVSPVQSCLVLFSPVQSCPVLSSPVQSCPALSHPAEHESGSHRPPQHICLSLARLRAACERGQQFESGTRGNEENQGKSTLLSCEPGREGGARTCPQVVLDCVRHAGPDWICASPDFLAGPI
jgi:hypothetical protein